MSPPPTERADSIRAKRRLEYHLTLDDSDTVPLTQLAQHSGLSKQALKGAMNKGAVWVGQGKKVRRWRRVDKYLPPGTAIHLYYDAELLGQRPPAPTLIADEGDYSVWDKPCGLYSQGSKWGDHFAIDRWVAKHLQPQRPAFMVHRLDRAARGLILIAHRRATAAALSALFQERTVEKRYQAAVHGRFPAGPARTIDSPIDGRHAISHAALLHYLPASDRSLLDVRIETGRKHQIRRHLAGIGFVIVGDRLHGGPGERTEDLQLCAYQLAFNCPMDQRTVVFTLPEGHGLTPSIDCPNR